MTQSLQPTDPRPLGAAFAACGLASLVLLANHPASGAHDFAGVLQEEAAHRFIDGVVHGGFVLVLATLIVNFVLLGRRLGAERVPVVICTVAFCIGAAACMASMILDGLVIPAVAVRYAGVSTPESLAAAKSLFVFAGSLIGFLMPMGIAFQSLAMLSLGALLAAGTPRLRLVGRAGALAGILIVALLVLVPPGRAAHVMLAGIALLGLWYLALAVLLWNGRLG
ncbi:MAG: hypothetical protein JSR36_02690 [Proteobacteria bacterium]|nr:hypothetical protein [Pseudomonadota bacterium]